MDAFSIKDANGEGTIEFFDRVPIDRVRLLQDFRIKLTDQNLQAAVLVQLAPDMSEWDPDYGRWNPARLFAEMARSWTGWPGELVWQSLENDLALRCTHDWRGHVSIRVEMHARWIPSDWQVISIITVEAGQLEALASRALTFFGLPR